MTFTSSSTVTNVVSLLGGTELLRNVQVACIGPITAKTCEDQKIAVHTIAEEYTISGLTEAVRQMAAGPAEK